MKIDVILPAAGRIDHAFATETGTEIKALFSLGGQTILGRTIAALRDIERIDRIVVIGPEEIGEHRVAGHADIVLPEGKSGPDNIFRGLEWLRKQTQPDDDESRRVLILTTDLPFITSTAITSFLDSCQAQADIYVPIIERNEFEAIFPDSPNFYVRLRDGQWTLGCAFLLNPEAIINHRQSIERVFEARKSQIQMARLLGPLFILRFLTRRLTVEHVAQQCEQILDCKGNVVLGAAPELAYDIDLPIEYHYALKRFVKLDVSSS